MPLDTSVKLFHSGMQGVGGSFLFGRLGTNVGTTYAAANAAILKNIFVEGFNTQTASSLTVSSNVATMVFGSSHGFEDHCVISISGASPSGLNGEKRITYVNSTTLTFDATGLSDQSATGTITAKYASLGWSYVGATPSTSPVTFRSTHPSGTQLGVTFNGTTYDGAVYSSNDFSGFAISAYRIADASQVGSLFGTRYTGTGSSSAYSYVPCAWIVVGDGRTFYLLLGIPSLASSLPVGLNNNGAILGAGEFESLVQADAYRSFLNGASIVSPAHTSAANLGLTTLGYHVVSASTGALALAGTSGGSAVAATYTGMEHYVTSGTMAGAVASPFCPSYPNGPDQSLILVRKLISEGSGLRGYFRGLYQSPQACATSFNAMDKVSGQGALLGRKLLAVRNGESTGSSYQPGTGVTFFDITGPWA